MKTRVLQRCLIVSFVVIVLVVSGQNNISQSRQGITSVHIAGGFKKPVYLTSPNGISDNLYVVEQRGIIQVVRKGVVNKTPFLDISRRVHNPKSPGDERGLLCMAFHSDFSRNGYFFVNYINRDGNTIISRFSSTEDLWTGDEESEVIILQVEQPFSNHNGGQLAFCPRDDYLYIGLGDGGSAGDPQNNAQDLTTFLGKILRIDVNSGKPYSIPQDNPFVSHPLAQPEIWAYGLRNPWRFSFDLETGDIYIGDVGQDNWEEINFQEGISRGGENYGWHILEGNHCYNPQKDCEQEGLTRPIYEYPNDANYYKSLFGIGQDDVHGCSVTGGYVYRGKDIPHLSGTYFFADYCTGNVWSFIVKSGEITHFRNRTDELNLSNNNHTINISSFGLDSRGELYIIDYSGDIYQIRNIQ